MDKDYVDRLVKLCTLMRANYDSRPVTRDEWDVACGDALALGSIEPLQSTGTCDPAG